MWLSCCNLSLKGRTKIDKLLIKYFNWKKLKYLVKIWRTKFWTIMVQMMKRSIKLYKTTFKESFSNVRTAYMILDQSHQNMKVSWHEYIYFDGFRIFVATIPWSLISGINCWAIELISSGYESCYCTACRFCAWSCSCLFKKICIVVNHGFVFVPDDLRSAKK